MRDLREHTDATMQSLLRQLYRLNKDLHSISTSKKLALEGHHTELHECLLAILVSLIPILINDLQAPLRGRYDIQRLHTDPLLLT